MKCHYEVLNVSRSADDNEIKSAYRKLALKWHPDKNLDNPAVAKEQFQIVQQAYEILSDRQERAWYDNHRDQILRGPSSEFEDKSLNVFQYFTTTCFKGYGDDEKGFYAVYRKVFHEIAKEDMEFMEDKDDFCNIPDFGNSSTDYEKVSEFYAHWLNYLTKKSYVWLDAYDVRLIQDRRYAKLAEKENKKVRQAAKKDRNEEVRNLVAFVKKRDKRVQAQKVLQEQKLEEDKRKREMLRQQKKLERQEELKGSENQPEWAKFDNVKSELKEIEKNLAEQFGEEISNSECEEEEEYLDDLYCVACNKLFKTPKAFENHESSKKHKENIEILRATMMEEEEEELNPSEHSDEQVEDNHEELDEVLEEIQNDALSDSDSVAAVVKTKKKKKKPRTVMVSSDEEIPNIGILETNDNSDDDFSTNKRSKKKKKNSNKAKVETIECNEVSAEIKEDPHPETESSAGKISKKEKRKEKKNKKEAPVETNSTEVDIDHVCVTCKGNFPSKNKLFDHLKKSRHGVYIPELTKSKNKKKSLKEE